MKILFKNITKYDKENRNNFKMFHAEKYGVRDLLKFIIIAICIIYIFIFNLISKNWPLILGIILLGVLLYFMNTIKLSETQKTKKKIKQYTFYFYEKYIKIKYKRQFERMRYFEIKKIFETEENFFLYTDENHSLILDKEGFEIGTPKEFVGFIKRKCPFKYSNEKNK